MIKNLDILNKASYFNLKIFPFVKEKLDWRHHRYFRNLFKLKRFFCNISATKAPQLNTLKGFCFAEFNGVNQDTIVKVQGFPPQAG